MRNKIFYIGMILIITCFIACVMSYYLIIYGIPVFLLGALFVFLSKERTQTKILTTLIPIVLYIPCTFLFLYIYNYSTPKTILIPKNFEGKLRVVYEEKCGCNYDEVDGVKTLTFKENLILILNEDFDGNLNFNYYFIDELGNKTEIPGILNLNERVQTKPFVLAGASGSISQPIEANSFNKEEKGITYSDFYIYNKDTISEYDNKIEQRFDSLTTIIVNQCRNQK